MDIAHFYQYLMRTRRDLWSCLESAPAEIPAKSVIPGKRFHSINDLVFHIAEVEDAWLNLDIRRATAVLERFPDLGARADGPNFGGVRVNILLDYWREVEKDTQRYLGQLTEDELDRRIEVAELSEEPLTVENLLWHVLQHEVRHSAQIVLLLRQQGIKPPSLDLLFYLPLQ